MNVGVADLRADSAAGVVDEIRGRGGRAFPIEVDVTSEAALAAAAAEVERTAGGLNLLCANAGVLARIATLQEHTIQDWEYTLSVNVLGVVKTVDAFLPLLLRAAPEAHIVNTASLGGLIATEGFPIGAYIASKYACVGYSEMLRAELDPLGVGVSVLCPGVVESSLVGTSMANRPPELGTQAAPAMQGPGQDADETTASVNAMAAEDVGPVVLDAIRANRLHVLTHPNARGVVEARFAGLLDDFDFAAKSRA